jgi:predicted YcjX-like family ATPase
VNNDEYRKYFSLENLEKIKRTALGIRTQWLLFNAKKFDEQLSADKRPALVAVIDRLVESGKTQSQLIPIDQQEIMICDAVRATGTTPHPFWSTS